MSERKTRSAKADEVLGGQSPMNSTDQQNENESPKKQCFRLDDDEEMPPAEDGESSDENEMNLSFRKKPPMENFAQNINLGLQQFSIQEENKPANSDVNAAIDNIRELQIAMNNTLKGIVELMQPVVQYIPKMMEQNAKKKAQHKSRYRNILEEEWKKDFIVLDGKKQRTLRTFSNRNEVKQLIMNNQDNNPEWKAPQINGINLKEEIQTVLAPFFLQLDQPRKFGLAISQFLFGADYFLEKNVPMFKAHGDNSKQREALISGRTFLGTYEFALLGTTLLFCGAQLIAEFPNESTQNMRLHYMNTARDAINSEGQTLKKKKNIEDYTNHLAHIDHFVPVLKRPELIAAAKQEIAFMAKKKAAEKEKKRNREQAICKMLQTTPLSTQNPFKNPFKRNASMDRLGKQNEKKQRENHPTDDDPFAFNEQSTSANVPVANMPTKKVKRTEKEQQKNKAAETGNGDQSGLEKESDD